jgi:hypothetical protein
LQDQASSLTQSVAVFRLSGGSGRIAAPVVGKGSGRDARAPVRRETGSRASRPPANASNEWEEF